MNSKSRSGLVVFSGGSAANSLVDVFDTVIRDSDRNLSYVIPISDNGGSSSELIRVFGGPGIGDVRRLEIKGDLMGGIHLGRLVRLIPTQPSDPENTAIRTFFNHRLPPCADTARLEWLDIVEARSPLWRSISASKKELIRSFLNYVNLEIVKRQRPPTSTFNFQSAAIGNMFLTGARLFCGSFEAAIYLLDSITGVPEGVHVVPAINSNFSHHISAELENGEVIIGQNSISHPSAPTALPSGEEEYKRAVEEQDRIEDANLPGSLPTLRKQYIAFSKDAEEDLPSRIQRIWYINPFGQEIHPPANPGVIQALDGAECLVYSIGSLYTSIVPSLILRGVGEAIASPAIRYKILILNGALDRETGPPHSPFTGLDFIEAIACACRESRGQRGAGPSQELKAYVTHLVHLEGEGVPKVDAEALKGLGIECVRLYGRKTEGGAGRGMRYDGKALSQALEVILGRGAVAKGEVSRRNTFNAKTKPVASERA
ncbi:MAG: hypothetical protein M4579_001391 [Chaenotheca gracillima]|nr:MAG: hypothetical protein M4579_001391 [Chaenotheca gracillima]